MTEVAMPAPSSKIRTWIGWTLTILVSLFLLFSGGIKLLRLDVVAETMQRLGWPAEAGFPIGVLEVFLTLLYVVPRTSVLGAVLLTGLLGGAIATHVRIDDPLFSHNLFGVYMGLFVWGGLWLRDAKLRALFPIRR
jgi:hypothetical protein